MKTATAAVLWGGLFLAFGCSSSSTTGLDDSSWVRVSAGEPSCSVAFPRNPAKDEIADKSVRYRLEVKSGNSMTFAVIWENPASNPRSAVTYTSYEFTDGKIVTNRQIEQPFGSVTELEVRLHNGQFRRVRHYSSGEYEYWLIVEGSEPQCRGQETEKFLSSLVFEK
jgi:hypothetical protein